MQIEGCHVDEPEHEGYAGGFGARVDPQALRRIFEKRQDLGHPNRLGEIRAVQTQVRPQLRREDRHRRPEQLWSQD